MIRVLHSVSYMHRGGVENFLMNYYRNIDKSLIQFDFLCNQQVSGTYDAEIRELGGRIFYRPKELSEKNYTSFWKHFLITHPEIQILHTHNGAKQYYPLQGALEAGVKVRIAHGHCSDFEHDNKYSRRRKLIEKLPTVATHCFACSEPAGRFYFGESWNSDRGILVHNAVSKTQYRCNGITRNSMRNSLGLNNNLVIGHVGRFDPQKNHERLLHIFSAVYAIEKNV